MSRNRTIKKTTMAVLVTVMFSSQVLAAEQDVSDDIPVKPINAERIDVKTPSTKGAVSRAVDKAMVDAMAKSLPAKSVEEYKKKKQAMIEGNAQTTKVDSFGMSLPDVKPLNPKLIGHPKAKATASPVRQASSAQQQVATAQRLKADIATPVDVPLPQVRGTEDPIVDKLRKNYKQHQTITLKPGDGALAPVAAGLQNRIKTPFTHAVIKTSSKDLPAQVDGGYIYVTPLDQEPIGLIVGEEGMPETMVNLTLMPLAVPPVMIDLKVDMGKKLKLKQQEYTAKQKRIKAIRDTIHKARTEPEFDDDPRVNTDHIDRTTDILYNAALGRVPNGFDLDEDIPEDERFPCDIDKLGMYHEVKQRMTSGREILDVALVTNDLNGFREIREEYCLGPDVIATGVFDKATLAPGESAEVFILRDKLFKERQEHVRARPSLVENEE